MTEYNIYCDESCHLENDRQPIMVLGGMWNDFISDGVLIVEGKTL